jgi:hypothetical protein
MSLLTTTGAAASITSAVYTRKAFRAQQAAARRPDLDLELGQRSANENAPGTEPSQIDHPESTVLPTPRPPGDSFRTTDISGTTFHTAEGISAMGNLANTLGTQGQLDELNSKRKNKGDSLYARIKEMFRRKVP